MVARVSFEWAWIQFARAVDKLQSLFVRTKEITGIRCGFTRAHRCGAIAACIKDAGIID